MILGPVSSAAHSEATVGGAPFFIAVGLSVLIYAWFRFFRSEHGKPKPVIGNLIGLSVICCVMIVLGIWDGFVF